MLFRMDGWTDGQMDRSKDVLTEGQAYLMAFVCFSCHKWFASFGYRFYILNSINNKNSTRLC